VAVASAGPHANLHLAPDRQQHPTTHFLQAGCPSCRPTNSVKALKAFDQNFSTSYFCLNVLYIQIMQQASGQRFLCNWRIVY